MAEETDYGYAADLLYAELRRAWPDDVSKEALLEGSGLSPEEARAGLKILEEKKRLDETAEGYKAIVGDEVDEAAARAIPGDEAEEPPTAEEEAAPPQSPSSPAPFTTGVGATYHAQYALQIAFSGSHGQSPEAAIKTARAMEEQVADALHQLFPGAVVSAELKKIEVYDKPREIPLEGDDD